MDRKLSLDLGTIAVDAFETGKELPEARGTVEAHEECSGCPWSEPLSCPVTSHSCTDL